MSSDNNKIKTREIREVVYPKTNREIFGVRFYLAMYQLGDNGKVDEGIAIKKKKISSKNEVLKKKYELKKDRSISKQKAKNEKRSSKGLYTKDIKYKRFKPKAYKPTLREWLTSVVGESPVLYDSLQVLRAAKQIELYLSKKGFFDAQVNFKVYRRNLKKQRVKVEFFIQAPDPYRIRYLDYDIPDSTIKLFVASKINKSRIRSGVVFNEKLLQNERKRITSELQNKGYFDFKENNITYLIDSTDKNRELDILLKLDPEVLSLSEDTTSTGSLNKRYTINHIQVTIKKQGDLNVKYDTIHRDQYSFVYFDKLRYRPSFLKNNILFEPSEYYNADLVKKTYNRLSSLSVYKYVKIEFVKKDSSSLNCLITLIPSKKNSYSVETNGTVRGSDLGVNATLTLNNKNTFRGAEVIRFKLTGGLEAQRLITQNEQTNEQQLIFKPNTIQLAPEVSLVIPKILLPFVKDDKFKKLFQPRTSLSFSLNYQDQPDFKRTNNRISFSYEWKTKSTFTQIFKPFDLSLIKIDKSPEFEEYLNQINDPILLSSYQDNAIPAISYQLIYSNRNKKSVKNQWYNLTLVEAAGNIIRGLGGVFNLKQDSLGGYKLFDVTVAQYFKIQNDLRYTQIVNDKNTFAYRTLLGIAYPLKNLSVIPFERAYFAGGANDIRAWQARTLGPGSYFDPLRNYDKIGDIKIEFNAEYRFNLIDFLDGAIFADMGNVWYVKKNESKEGSEFELNRFYKELAIGTGVGIRLNFNFFLIRFDLGIQTYDPSLPEKERWVWQKKDAFNQLVDQLNESGVYSTFIPYYSPRLNLNLGIGFPF